MELKNRKGLFPWLVGYPHLTDKEIETGRSRSSQLWFPMCSSLYDGSHLEDKVKQHILVHLYAFMGDPKFGSFSTYNQHSWVVTTSPNTLLWSKTLWEPSTLYSKTVLKSVESSMKSVENFLTAPQVSISNFIYIFKNFKLICFMCMSVLFVCVFVHHLSSWCRWRCEEGIGFPETGAIECQEVPCGCYKLNPGLFKKKWFSALNI